MEKIINDRPIQGEEYRNNEISTNKMIAFMILCFVAIAVFNAVSLRWYYDDGLALESRYVFLPVSAVMIIIDIIAFAYRFRPVWVKYMLLCGVIFMSMAAFFINTLYSMYFIFLPICISPRYFRKKIIYMVSAVSISGFLILCSLEYYLDCKSEVFALLHEVSAYNSWTHPADIALYIVVPSLFLLCFLSVFGINLTESGRKLIIEQVKNHRKIYDVSVQVQMGAQIQKSMLPDGKFATENGNFSLSAVEIPAKDVCGDFYDYFLLSDEYLFVMIADVSDKGIPAAMYMMSAEKSVQCAFECCHTMEDAVKLINKLVCKNNECGMFLTMWLGCINIKSGVGKYINAGHPFPIIRHADGSTEFVSNEPDLFLGTFPEINPEVHDFVMRPGDVITLFTDGLTDAADKNGESFGTQRVFEKISSAEDSDESVCEAVTRSALDFSGNEDIFDDITVLSLKCNKTDDAVFYSRELQTGVDATKTVNDEIMQLLKDGGCPDEKRRNVGVVIDEICNNIALYSYGEEGGSFKISAKIGANCLRLVFEDGGVPFNPLEAESPEEGDEPQIGGFGIFFVKHLSDKLDYEYSENKNILTARFVWGV